jgi:hypothetical protein
VSKLVIGLLCMAIGALAATVVGMSMEEEKADAGAATTRFLNVPAASFVGRTQSTHNVAVGGTNACGYVTLPEEHGEFPELSGRTEDMKGSYIAPVFLPQGATVTALSLFTRDNNSNEDVFIYLARKKTQHNLGANQGYTLMANTKSAGGTGGNMRRFDDTSVSAAAIDNAQYAYSLEIVGCNINIDPVAVRITYTTP